MEIKEQIKRSISIVELATLYVDLKPAGKYYKALCPFHTEKTPSFFVMPEKDTFVCYGCNKFGDIFTLIQEMENLNFPDSITFIIEKFNLPIEKNKKRKTIEKDIYIEINEIALKYFRDNLNEIHKGEIARNYLKARGIKKDAIELFFLGYAENKWDGLYNYFKKNSCDIKKSIELGLLIKNNNKIYDRFRGRIIFPIFSETGAIIAFGGRTIHNDTIKYLNSPDTPLYKKSRNLYGFNLSKKFIRENKFSIIVEGYFDVISLYQNDIKNVAASLGTALTEDQIYLLKRFSEEIYIFFDSDKAGTSATVRGIEKTFEQNIIPKIISTNDSVDPDDFIRKNGYKAFKQLLGNSVDGFKYLVNKICKEYDLRIPKKKNEAIKIIMNVIEKINEPIIREEYIRQVADFFKVDINMLKFRSRNNLTSQTVNDEVLLSTAERIFLESLIAMPELVNEVKDLFNEEILSVLKSKNILISLFQNYNAKTNKIENYKKISEQMSEGEKKVFRKIFEKKDTIKKDKNQLEKIIESSFLKFQDTLNKRKTDDINQKIRAAEQENNQKEIIKLMMQKYEFIKRKYIRTQEE